jgi:hypothetical protein
MLLRSHIVSLGKRLSTAQKTEILDGWHRLESHISSFEQHIGVLMNVSNDMQWSNSARKLCDMQDSSDYSSDNDGTTVPEISITPEHDMILLPSSLAPGEINHHSLQQLAEVEGELRKGQINDSLQGLQLALGEKSLSFRAEV